MAGQEFRERRFVTLADLELRTAELDTPTVYSKTAQTAIVYIDIDDIDGTSATFTIKGLHPVTGSEFTVLASAAKTGTGAFTLTVGPNVATTSNVSAGVVLPRVWFVEVSHNTIADITYSIVADLID